MVTAFLNTFLILTSLFVIGYLFIIHFKKSTIVFAPWIGVVAIINIAYLINLAKIPMAKDVYELPFFNATMFTILVILFIGIFSLLQSKTSFFQLIKTNLIRLLVLGTLISFSVSLFSPQFESIETVNKVLEIQNISITHEILESKSIQNMNWQAGIPLFIAFYSKLLNHSIPQTARIIHGIFFILSAVIVVDLLINFGKLKDNKAYLIGIPTAIFCMILINQIYYLDITTLIIVGLLALFCQIILNYLSVIKNGEISFVSAEELILAAILVSAASIQSIFLWTMLGILVLGMFIYLFINKNISFVLLKVIIIMFVMNPLLVGLALRY